MKLVDNWRRILRRAWSIRFNLAAAALTGAVGAWSAFANDIPDSWYLGIAMALNVGALLARLLQQPGLTDDGKTPNQS